MQDGLTPLQLASAGGHMATVQALLHAGATITGTGPQVGYGYADMRPVRWE